MSLAALFLERATKTPDAVACQAKKRGRWRDTTWGAWAELSLAVASGLRGLGLEAGDRVAIIASNRFEWLMCEYGILLAGAIPVSLYPESPPRLTRSLIEDAGVRFAFVDGPLQLQKLLEPGTDALPEHIEHLFFFDDTDDGLDPEVHGRDSLSIRDLVFSRSDARVLALDALIERGNLKRLPPLLDASPDDTAALLFTPGTTGAPHAVPLTHHNLVHAADVLATALELGEEDSHLLILSLAHVFARTLTVAAMQRGFTTALSASPQALIEDSAEHQPTFLACPPWLFERVHAKILNDARAVGPIRRAFFEWALTTGLKQRTEDAPARRIDAIQGSIARRLVWSKLHDIFGANLRFFIAIGGPLDRDVAEFFAAAELLLLEGYTLTEASGLTAIARPGEDGFTPLSGVETRLDDEGQLWVRGPMVCDAHAEPDNWLPTHDYAERDDEARLQIRCRADALIVLTGGKRVIPRTVEEHLRRHPLIRQALVHGDERDYLTALIILDREAAMRWAGEHNMKFADFAALTQDRRIFEYISAAVEQVNHERAPRQPIKKFALLEAPFSPETGELTPLLQMRRHFVTARYRSILDSFYSEQY